MVQFVAPPHDRSDTRPDVLTGHRPADDRRGAFRPAHALLPLLVATALGLGLPAAAQENPPEPPEGEPVLVTDPGPGEGEGEGPSDIDDIDDADAADDAGEAGGDVDDAPDPVTGPAAEPELGAAAGEVSFTEDFAGDSLSLARFTRPARSIRVLDDSVIVSVSAASVVPGNHDGAGLAYRQDGPFESTEVLILLSDDDVSARDGVSAAVRVDAALYRMVDGRGQSTTLRAAVLAGDRGAGREVWAELTSVTDGGTRSLLADVTLVDARAAVDLGELFEVSIGLDGVGGVLVSAGSATTNLELPARAGDVDVEVTYAGTIVGDRDAPDGGGAARMAATLFDPYVNDEFIDLEDTVLERVRADEAPNLFIAVADGRAVLDLVGGDRETRVASVVARHPDDAPAVRTAGAVLSTDEPAVALAEADGATRVVLRVPLYNDTFDGNWNLLEGDVVARIGLERTSAGLRAVARVERFDDADGTVATLLADHGFEVAVMPDTDYTVSVQRDEGSVTFDFEGEVWSYAVPGDAFVPWAPAVAIESILDGAIGEVTGRFDTLNVGGTAAPTDPLPGPAPTPVPGPQPAPDPEPGQGGDQGTDPDEMPGAGPGDPSDPDGTPSRPTAPDGAAVPSAPPMAYGTAYSDNALELFWSAAGGAPGIVYEIERDGTVLDTVDARSYMDRNLSPGTMYDYRITAVSAEGARSESAVMVPIATLGAPSGLSAVQGLRAVIYSSTVAELFWERADDSRVAGYQIERDGTVVAEGRMTSLMLDDLDPREGAFLEVFAVDAAGNRSVGSGKVYVTTGGR